MRARLRAVALALPLLAAGCAGNTLPSVSDLKDSVSASLINAMTNTLAPSVNATIADGVAARQKDIEALAYALPWAQKAVDHFGRYLGMTAAQVAVVDSLVASAEADLKAPPTSVGAAVQEAVAAWRAARQALGLPA